MSAIPWCPACGTPSYNPKEHPGDRIRCIGCQQWGIALADEPDERDVWPPEAFRPVTVVQIASMLAALELAPPNGTRNRSTARLVELIRLLVEGALQPPRRS